MEARVHRVRPKPWSLPLLIFFVFIFSSMLFLGNVFHLSFHLDSLIEESALHFHFGKDIANGVPRRFKNLYNSQNLYSFW